MPAVRARAGVQFEIRRQFLLLQGKSSDKSPEKVPGRLRDGALLSGPWLLWSTSYVEVEALAGAFCEGECQSHGQR